jgi:hypothetical protein
VAILDLVLLHNKATEGQAKHEHLGLDVLEKVAYLRKEFIKFCKPFESHLHSNVKLHCVVAEVKEQSTDVPSL